ncbi:hypothetical protein E2C01_006057 [Portunus trituberculatus]|uniref:Uncharacterized protein n=1 Tax=Portunus trituberculatus TaxID=210409 RepID=A0A5B7CW30_PORTR|nr:hypothetical protein [Portunus trituberculatus]
MMSEQQNETTKKSVKSRADWKRKDVDARDGQNPDREERWKAWVWEGAEWRVECVAQTGSFFVLHFTDAQAEIKIQERHDGGVEARCSSVSDFEGRLITCLSQI